MGLVILAALLSAGLFVAFRSFAARGVPLLPAIVVNYIVACLCGLAVTRPWQLPDLSLLWLPSVVLGALFIGLFFLMGYSTQHMGVATTTVANRMSLVITIVVSVRVFHERPSALAWCGIALALVGVVLASWSGGASKGRFWWLPVLLFFGGGAGDSLLNAAQRTRTTSLTEGALAPLIFGAAAFFGLLVLLATPQRKQLLSRRVLLGGTVLGCVNYGSLQLLVQALAHSGLAASSVFPLVNIGTILFGSAASLLFFKDRLRGVQWAGLAVSIAALVLLVIAHA
jgi:drug/metabolite transporter (DMT)-like permease